MLNKYPGTVFLYSLIFLQIFYKVDYLISPLQMKKLRFEELKWFCPNQTPWKLWKWNLKISASVLQFIVLAVMFQWSNMIIKCLTMWKKLYQPKKESVFVGWKVGGDINQKGLLCSSLMLHKKNITDKAWISGSYLGTLT